MASLLELAPMKTIAPKQSSILHEKRLNACNQGDDDHLDVMRFTETEDIKSSASITQLTPDNSNDRFEDRTTPETGDTRLEQDNEDDCESDNNQVNENNQNHNQTNQTDRYLSSPTFPCVSTLKSSVHSEPLDESQIERLKLLAKIIRVGDYQEFLDLLNDRLEPVKISRLLNVFVDGQTALHLTLIHGRGIAWCKQLVSKGANPNLTNRSGWHPIHLAAFGGSRETLRYMIDCASDSLSLYNQV